MNTDKIKQIKKLTDPKGAFQDEQKQTMEDIKNKVSGEGMSNAFTAGDFITGFLSHIKGDQGERGEQGETGPQGESILGPKGEDGKDGLDGKDGVDGRNGIDGKDGTDGKDGIDGLNGINGKDGKDGKDSTPKEVIKLLKELPEKDRLDISHLRNSTQILAALGKKGSGYKLDDQRFHGAGVSSVSVATANGVSGSSSGGATPALTIALGAITPTSVSSRVIPRVLSAASYTTDTGTSINGDTLDMFIVTAQTGDLLFNNPSGTPTDGQKLIISVASSAASARALTWGNGYGATTVALPTTTAATTVTLTIGFIWSASKTLWQCVAVA